MASAVELAIVLSAKDTASSVLNGVSGSLKHVGDTADRAGGMFTGFLGGFAKIGLASAGIGALVGSISGLAQGMIKGNAEFERYETQFGVLLGSVDKAKERIGALSKFAATTPFELPEVVKAGKVLETFGLQGDKSMKRFGMSTEQVLQIVGDAAAGSGAQFDELALTFGKFSSGATGEAIMRMQELGLTTREELTAMGVRFDKSGSLISDKEKALATVFEAVNNRFGGMMAKQSMTFEGMTSNLMDWFGQTQRMLMAPLFEVLKDKLGAVLEFLNDPGTQAGLQSFAKNLADGFALVIEGTGRVIEAVSGVVAFLKSAWTEPGLAMDAFHELVFQFFGVSQDSIPGTISQGVELIAGLIKGMADVVGKVMQGDLVGAFTTGFEAFSTFRNGVITMIVDALPQILSTFQGWARAAVSWLTETAIPQLKAALPGYLTAMLTFITESIDSVVNALLAFGREFFAWVPKAIPPLLNELLALLSAMLSWLSEHSEEIGAKLAEWGMKFGEFIVTSAIPALLAALPGIIVTIAGWVLGTAIPAVIGILFKLGKGIITGILNGIESLTEDIGSAMNAKMGEVWQGAIAKAREWVRIGEAIVNGIRDGISNMWGGLMSKVRGLINLIPQSVRDLLGISSPSKVFAKIGSEIGAGLAQGIEASIPAAEAAAMKMANAVTSIADAALAAFNQPLMASTLKKSESNPDAPGTTAGDPNEGEYYTKNAAGEWELTRTAAFYAAHPDVLGAYGTGTTPMAISAESPLFTPGGTYTPTTTVVQTVINLDGEYLATAVGTYYTQDSMLAGGTL